MAELWMGAHHLSPSQLSADDKSLAALIGENPGLALGSSSVGQFGPQLPFLFKILSAATPLSLQAHPGKKQAERGFKKENDAGIPLASPIRNYKDDNHKPEILLAITDFSALCGFRDIEETLALFELIALPELAQVLRNTRNYPAFFGSILGLSRDNCCGYLSAIRQKLISRDATILPGFARRAFTLLAELLALFPYDTGVLAPLYLNIVDLTPGDALYLPEGILHSYIRGTGLELMANSDNVLRGGLTGKHIDKTELLSVLEPAPYVPKIMCSRMDDGIQRYITPSPEFELSAIRKTNGLSQYSFIADGPSIILGEKGTIILRSETDSFTVSQSVTVFVPATGNSILIEGQGSCYRASLPWKGCPE
jgi:mannose-6-phosphate isomerase